ncbi:ImmA/IrrE family metallo-endopeptidase [Vagococcus sp. BWB3-3]|uniref:ImmA/IrrE family metallo-endopeptidase n=1 Tax=Vagococcus allomyrinae TaxID=2794353 RepID=A0A940SWD3_9ENTE|nr:ImmA/IrrE family metallo-endopeptidase [Vagococcus allomyrinae]MBP1041263.1 ImmA/IrrE family metallo-endopeptidase [Vagococcus allomyrinae]
MTMNCGTTTKPNFKLAKTLAYGLLKTNQIQAFPVNPFALIKNEPNVSLISYSDFAKKSQLTLNEVIEFTQSSDGATAYLKEKERYLIFYNDGIKHAGRINYTLAHELAHIKLGHLRKGNTFSLSRNNIYLNDNPIFEAEADTLAAEVLIPSFLVRNLPDDDVTYLSTFFLVSRQCARTALNNVNYVSRRYSSSIFDVPLYLKGQMKPFVMAIEQKKFLTQSYITDQQLIMRR